MSTSKNASAIKTPINKRRVSVIQTKKQLKENINAHPLSDDQQSFLGKIST
jgi:hypothetical protein